MDHPADSWGNLGYLRTRLAIKMLFRPLKPIYLGKMKLPFTPGILPRRGSLDRQRWRDRSRELLTAEVFRSRLAEPALKTKIEQSLYIVIDEFLGNDASAMLKGLAEGAAGQDTTPRRRPRGLLARRGPALGRIQAALAEAAGRAASAAGSIPLGDFLPAARLRDMAERFAEDWGEDSKQAMVGAFVDRLIDSSPDSGPLVSARALSPLLEVGTRSLYSSLLPVMEKILESEPMRRNSILSPWKWYGGRLGGSAPCSA